MLAILQMNRLAHKLNGTMTLTLIILTAPLLLGKNILSK
nr:MAG TPA: hypothetical protein [Caudoviricetes sp.]